MGHVALAILVSGVAATMTDWFFGGVLFHDKYLAYPEVWRRVGDAAGERRAIVWSVVLGFLTCGVFVLTYSSFQVHGYVAAIRFALAVWLIAPLPLLITNSLFIKMHPLTVVAHSLGWMVKLLLAGIAGAWLVS
ncbi:MAG TPA: hypothetical protein VJX16_27330 [Terriglobales bacterium]|nr:hypothetical protein [Terriglobales bacterium]